MTSQTIHGSSDHACLSSECLNNSACLTGKSTSPSRGFCRAPGLLKSMHVVKRVRIRPLPPLDSVTGVPVNLVHVVSGSNPRADEFPITTLCALLSPVIIRQHSTFYIHRSLRVKVWVPWSLCPFSLNTRTTSWTCGTTASRLVLELTSCDDGLIS